MAELKTKKTTTSVQDYLEAIEDEQRRQDCSQLNKLIENITGRPPKMWGDSMVGFGEYHYKYESGREGNFFIIGFANRKQSISIYLTCEPDEELLPKLGTYKMGKACLYINRLNDIDQEILSRMITSSINKTAEKFEIVE